MLILSMSSVTFLIFQQESQLIHHHKTTMTINFIFVTVFTLLLIYLTSAKLFSPTLVSVCNSIL
jgi:uncharacterized membrane protein